MAQYVLHGSTFNAILGTRKGEIMDVNCGCRLITYTFCNPTREGNGMALSKLDKINNALVDWRVEELAKVDKSGVGASSRYLQKKEIDKKFDAISREINK